MDAELSRRAAQVKNSPYWRYLISTRSDEDAEQFDDEFINALVKAGNYDKLSDEIKAVFDMAERSYQIAEAEKLDPLKTDELQQIVEKLK